MTTSPADALREQAREWGRALLATPPWSNVSERVSLLLVSPPSGLDLISDGATLWLAIDGPSARSLPPEVARPLSTDTATIHRHRASTTAPAVTLVVATDTTFDRLMQASTRRALEARWQARHADPIADRLRRGEQFSLRAGLLQDDAPERVVRTLWVDASSAARALDAVTTRPADSLIAAGDLAGSLTRIACFNDEGCYPPAEFLLPVARGTRIGGRIARWLDDLVPALGGDEAAARRLLGSREQAMAEVAAVLGERYRDRPWLRDPEGYALRTPR